MQMRSRVVWGTAMSPGGTTHKYLANTGLTPDGCSDAGKAVLRGANAPKGFPGHSYSSPVMVSASPVQQE